MTIKGIPNGWEVVEFRYACEGEYFLSNAGKIERWVLGRKSDCVLPIIRKIEKPRRYRPFANAAEFEPHRDRWVKRTYNGDQSNAGCFKFHAYDNEGIYDVGRHFSYQEMFDDGRQFDDGTPFGIEVTE